MPRANEPLQKHTLLLYAGDYEKLGDLYPEISAAVVLRKVVRNFLNSVEAGVSNDDIAVEVKI